MKNSSSSVIAVIPARLASTRFPGKPLALIDGEAMITHVIRRAREAESLSRILVATDDEKIASTAEAAGAEAVMTGVCPSGTDRVAEAVLGRKNWNLVVNIQGDEPLLSARNIDVLVRGMLENPDAGMGTLCRPLPESASDDPNAVKLVRRNDLRALYFSRAPIPFFRDEKTAGILARLHLGIYAYRREALEKLVSLAPSPLEQAEKLEQLRALENGMEILVFDAPDDAYGVDTPEDLEKIASFFTQRKIKED